MFLKSWTTFAYFLKAYPLRGALMVFALTIAGLLEGLGIASLLPLISLLTEQSANDTGIVFQSMTRMFGFFGLENNIPSILIFIVMVMLTKAVVTLGAIAQVAWSSAHVTANLRTSFLQTLLKANWLHYVSLRSGATVNALGMEAQRAALSFKQGCLALSYLIQIMIYAALALMISGTLMFAALGAGALLVVILSALTREARKAGAEQTRVFDRVLTMITDSLLSAKPLKAMNKGEHMTHMMQSDIKALQSAQRRMDMTDQSLIVIAEPLMLIFIALGLYGALEFNVLPLSELLFLAVLSLRLVMRVTSAQRAYQSMAANESALWSLLGKVNTAKSMPEIQCGSALPSLKNEIEVKDVRYAYDEKEVLKGISLSLPAKKFHVIYGSSGAGKTTLIDIITGLLEAASGDILIDGTPLKTIDLNAWRRMIGYVPQDILLFHDSVSHNITLGDDAISDEDVRHALEQAEALEFIMEFEDGIDTVVGERGAKLSGGQRQRLALARALVHHPEILILDEATSALDQDTEKAVLKTVQKLSQSMTVLAISHNKALLDVADHVYYLRDGQLEKHEALTAKTA